jgi:hypothetical protein
VTRGRDRSPRGATATRLSSVIRPRVYTAFTFVSSRLDHRVERIRDLSVSFVGHVLVDHRCAGTRMSESGHDLLERMEDCGDRSSIHLEYTDRFSTIPSYFLGIVAALWAQAPLLAGVVDGQDFND